MLLQLLRIGVWSVEEGVFRISLIADTALSATQVHMLYQGSEFKEIFEWTGPSYGLEVFRLLPTASASRRKEYRGGPVR
jgi:hypothetical protein